MKVNVEYTAQLKRIIGDGGEIFEVDEGTTLSRIISIMAEKYGDKLQDVLLDKEGNLQPSVLVSVNDAQADPLVNEPLRDGDRVSFMSPMAGG